MSDFVSTFVQAIATAEGYFVNGSRPQRNNNPGDLTLDLTGTGIGWDGPFVVYGSPQDGFDALTRQVVMMLDGSSHIYSPDMSILQVAQHYTQTDVSAWANTVAQYLGTTVNTTLNQLASNYPQPIGIMAIVLVLGVWWYTWKRKG